MSLLEKQLPSKAEMDALLSDINQAGLGRSLQFELFRPGQVVVKDYYAELPIAVRVTGRYHDMGAFAADMANLSRIVTLNNLSIAAAEGRRADDGRTAKTFRYLDPEEQARKARRGARGRRNDGAAKHRPGWRWPSLGCSPAASGSEREELQQLDGRAARPGAPERAADLRAEEVHAAGLHRRRSLRAVQQHEADAGAATRLEPAEHVQA